MTFGVGPSLFGQIWLGTLQLAILESNTQYKRNRGGGGGNTVLYPCTQV